MAIMTITEIEITMMMVMNIKMTNMVTTMISGMKNTCTVFMRRTTMETTTWRRRGSWYKFLLLFLTFDTYFFRFVFVD